MAKLVPSEFSSYALSEQEYLSAAILTDLQKKLIQTDLAQIASSILNLHFDPLNPQTFVQDDAHQKGQLAAYRVLLLRSDEAEEKLRFLQSQSSQEG